MAKEIVKAQPTGIQIFAPAAPEDKFAGIPQAGNFLPVFKQNYLGGCFDVPDDPPRIAEFDALIIHLQEGLRRDFETIFKQGVVVPPVCYSVDGEHGSKAQVIRDFKVAGRKSIYGTCKTCFYSQFKSACAWQDSPDGYGPGVQCSNYVLAFLLQILQHPEISNEGEVTKPGLYRPIVLQVPPTSVGVVSWNLANWIGKAPGATIFNVAWNFQGTGGSKPRSQNTSAINTVLLRGAALDEVRNVKSLQTEMAGQIEEMSLRFASGGDISTPTGGGQNGDENLNQVGSAEI